MYKINYSFYIKIMLAMLIVFIVSSDAKGQISLYPINAFNLSESQVINTYCVKNDLLLAGTYKPNKIKLWNTKSNEIILDKTMDHSLTATAISNDNLYAFAGDIVGEGYIFSIASGDVVSRIQTPFYEPIERQFSAAEFTPNGEFLVTTTFYGHLQLWDIHSGEEVKRFGQNVGNCRKITFFPDGKRFLSTTGFTANVFTSYNSNYASLTLSGNAATPLSNSSTVMIINDAYAGRTAKINYWNADTGELIKSSNEFSAQGRNLEIFPSGKFVVDYNDPEQVIIRNIETGEIVRKFTNEETTIDEKIQFSSDGKLYSANKKELLIFDVSDLTSSIEEAPMHK